MKVNSLPYEFELLDNVKLYNGGIYRIFGVTDYYEDPIKIIKDEDIIKFTITESMLQDKYIRIYIEYSVESNGMVVMNTRRLNIEVDFILPIYFKCLPFEKIKMVNNII